MKSREIIIRMKPEVKERFAHFFNNPEELECAVRFAEERALAFWGVYSKWRDTIFAPVSPQTSCLTSPTLKLRNSSHDTRRKSCCPYPGKSERG